jgi:hypothetical protein
MTEHKKKTFNTKPDGVRRVGRPKLRWENGVDQDMRILKVKKWKRVALDGDEWAKLLKNTGDPPRAVETTTKMMMMMMMMIMMTTTTTTGNLTLTDTPHLKF